MKNSGCEICVAIFAVLFLKFEIIKADLNFARYNFAYRYPVV
ncbi:hypothetical protein CAMSH0001_1585 [Campylobacter showae RM3277]|uniref:Uncharacterized protein n=1 Tax=Campylobacter showae RM3277 TaxID=553219 RepID=C6RCZ8_9BACT|nr:hypothetical protein CAMSH0001_1585 [Campylobacter showae RM3277]